ncbi:zf-TFIIB domain-containing protein [Shimia sp. R10_1]|uniref:TFIIB-type zinc ribbon-containing protein n=1 Tax=Shimia sp. R10_1 TaxID=2821095 RepID=UPI001ADD46BB|nr:zf-TFIIB domain-containing protein [Shimia sp. R10_1]MBO9474198.1 zf-TFIIB domain-containing protein [Shimia sp. R10_1]
MKCPVDGATLVIADRNGVEIDYCPECRGVWLDRGELDKIVERAGAYSAPPPPPRPSHAQEQRGYDQSYDSRYQGKPRKKKKMSSFLDDIFDF